MIDSFFKWIKHVVRGLLVAFPLVASYGFLFPWPAAEQALSRYPGQTPIMVSTSFHSRVTWSARSRAWVTREKEQTRSYVLFPAVFSSPKIITVSQTNDNEPTVSESGGPLIALALAGMTAFVVLGFWYFEFRLPRRNQLSPEEAKTFYGSRLPQRDFGRRIS